MTAANHARGVISRSIRMQVSLPANNTLDGEAAFDLEEFKALKNEIQQKVDATSRLEVFCVTGASAVYAWLPDIPQSHGRFGTFQSFFQSLAFFGTRSSAIR
jgi:hypothetical protein